MKQGRAVIIILIIRKVYHDDGEMTRMEEGNKRRLLIWLVVALLLVAAVLWMGRPRPEPAETGPRLVATVSVDNREVVRVDLGAEEDREFSIVDETGLPITFQIRDHAIRFLHSDCPDKVCIHTGFLKNDLDVACCLPNRTILMVELVEG